MGGIDRFKRATARRLRSDVTSAEQRLWRALKAVPLHGSHFRRQVPIGRFVADFACPKAKLVIELDGGQHGLEANSMRDAARTRWLEAQGYRVIRFWNREIVDNLHGVLDTIYAALYGSPHSEAVPPTTPLRRAKRADPPPSRGG
jgi:very-short-patch-repair endonuclease